MTDQPDDIALPIPVLPPSPFAPQGEWVHRAACRQAEDPTIFDAPDVEDRVTFTNVELARRQRQAAAVCAGCPVRAECLDDAVENDLSGIRGGVLIVGRDTKRQVDLIALAAAGRLMRPAGWGRPPQTSAA